MFYEPAVPSAGDLQITNDRYWTVPLNIDRDRLGPYMADQPAPIQAPNAGPTVASRSLTAESNQHLWPTSKRTALGYEEPEQSAHLASQ